MIKIRAWHTTTCSNPLWFSLYGIRCLLSFRVPQREPRDRNIAVLPVNGARVQDRATLDRHTWLGPAFGFGGYAAPAAHAVVRPRDVAEKWAKGARFATV